MVYIWEEYEKEMEKKHKGISKTKGFRYPPVLPIIFYDGASKWTASTQLKERKMAELFANFKGYDVQAARAEAKRLGMEEGLAEGHAEGRAEGRVKGRAEGRAEERESGIEKLIKAAHNFNVSQEKVCQQLIEQYDLSESEASEKIARYWE